ncbi:hypothetical protein [Hymenobacter jeollabukensis]|uniref:RHS repeat protein n=1 Tax=Hymenobacter jeollabukensis TaxID=2025313 RepID=A0A5R8WME3_9BACT|nr:hypothetical protein [Hymenobacter jeollabukensis]TLM90552.1 hypothetical protein FDY95_17710 [Hymenobacter jeollabukensis]
MAALLLSSLLAARAAVAQSVIQNGVVIPGNPRLPLGYYGWDPMRRVTSAPAAWLPDATANLKPVAPLHPEPDTATQRVFARNRVRSVLRLQLDDEGMVRDTVGYQEIDPQGRWTMATTGSANSPSRRQWGYDAQGQCVSRVDAPTQRWPFLTLYYFNPATQQGVQKAFLSDGSSPILAETHLYQHGDTTLAQSWHYRLTVNGRPYGTTVLQRVYTYTPHPDTALTLHCYYSAKGRVLRSQASYRLYRQGRPIEYGQLPANALTGNKTRKQEGAQELQRMLSALRHGQPRQVHQRFAYDRWRRLVRHETTTTSPEGTVSTTSVRFTYNVLHQLIGREESVSTGTQGQHYTVFSYTPTGLLERENTNRHGGKNTFYRYLYAYYE